jgi:hypothetical protein
MKNWLLVAALLLLAVGTNAQVRTVTEYFLAFPNDKYVTEADGRMITDRKELAEFRRSLIKVEDIRNGYLRLEGAWEGWAEIALFKKKDGKYLVGQAETGCGPVCTGGLTFYEYTDGRWTDVTEDVFPFPGEYEIRKAFAAKRVASDGSSLDYFYRLPRVGTTVRMYCNLCSKNDADVPLMDFRWNGAKFSASR